MIRIEKEKLEYIPAIRKVNEAAFNKENEANLVDAIRQSEEFIPELSLVALDQNERIVGHILFSRVYIDLEDGEAVTIALAPMAVVPDFQDRGVGSSLVTEGLKHCSEMGFKHVMVLGHPNFYPKFGFVPASRFGIKPPFPVPDDVFMAIELSPGALNNIRGTVKYPEAFNNV